MIRAIKPEIGIERMIKRREKKSLSSTLISGPGTLTQALGISIAHNGLPLTGPEIWIEDQGLRIPFEHIQSGPRIGIDYAGEHAALPWRFILI